VVLAGLVVLWPGGVPSHERSGVGFDRQTESGKVMKVEAVDCADVNISQQPAAVPARTGRGRRRKR
jgi:hypothetical protein